MLGISTQGNKICFPELSYKLFGYNRDKTSRHKKYLEDKGICFKENVRFQTKTAAGVKEVAAVKTEEFRDILLNINLSKSPHEKLLKTIRDNH